jgi:hypothetical protein
MAARVFDCHAHVSQRRGCALLAPFRAERDDRLAADALENAARQG